MQDSKKPIIITVYTWAGSWGPFHIAISCGECSLTQNIIKDVLQKDFSEYSITLIIKEWLPNWWRVIIYGGWHAPIVMVNHTIISQGVLLDRDTLVRTLANYTGKIMSKRVPLKNNDSNVQSLHEQSPQGTVIFHQPHCEHCKRALKILEEHHIPYTAYDVIALPQRAQQMFVQTKRHLGTRTPITTPQIWIDGLYVGGADELASYFNTCTS